MDVFCLTILNNSQTYKYPYLIKGVALAMQNIGLAATSILAGVIKDVDETYVWLEIFYIGWVTLAVLTTSLMWFVDSRKNNYLFMSEKQRKIFMKTPEYFQYLHIDVPNELIIEGKVDLASGPIRKISQEKLIPQ